MVDADSRAFWWNYGPHMCLTGHAPRHIGKHRIVDGIVASKYDCMQVCFDMGFDDYCWGLSYSKENQKCMVYLEEVTGTMYDPPQWPPDADCLKRYLKEPPSPPPPAPPPAPPPPCTSEFSECGTFQPDCCDNMVCVHGDWGSAWCTL